MAWSGHESGLAVGSNPRRSVFVLLQLMAVMALAVAGCGEGSSSHAKSHGNRGTESAERIQSTALHAQHAKADQPVGCEQCHEKLSGQFLPAKSWQCQACHEDAPLVLHAAATEDTGARDCMACHDFTAADATPKTCASCHATPQGSLPAIGPHDPATPDEACATCHRAHASPSLVSTECESCHDEETVTGHAKPDIQITGCASCHGYHEDAEVSSGRCTNCHRQSRAEVSMKATFANGHDKCVTCHRQHRFLKAEVQDCRAECHDGVVVLAQAKVEEHRRCTACHDKHDVRGSLNYACKECHGKVSPKHPVDKKTGSRCTGCHEPHGGPGKPVAAACSSCHDEARSETGLHQGAGHRGPACRNCHAPHKFDLKKAGVGLCETCHGAKPFRGAATIQPHAKHSDCFQCHGETVAHAPAGKRVACATCHEDQASVARKDHKQCVGCHDPHTTKQQAPCGSCHEAQAKAAHASHRDCAGCHEPHSTVQKQACGGCHQRQALTAPDQHRECMQCHDQHSTAVKKPCASCHEDRATGIHAKVKGGCANCHRPHGPKGRAKPPACKSCHDRALPALHRSEGHVECGKCHQSHGDQKYRRRGTCLACHEEQKQHEPEAAMCVGCHMFGGGP